MATVDPITLGVIWGALQSITVEVGTTVHRTAHSRKRARGRTSRSESGMNSYLNYTRSYCYAAVRCLTDPDGPQNDGAFRAPRWVGRIRRRS